MRILKCKKCGMSFEVGPGDKRKVGRCFQCGASFNLPNSHNRTYAFFSICVCVLLTTFAAFYFAWN